MGFCDSSAVRVAELQRARISGSCAICTFILNEVEQALSEESTQDEIISLLENVCAKVPSPMDATCDSYVEQYLPWFVDSLLKNEPGDVICIQVGLCEQ